MIHIDNYNPHKQESFGALDKFKSVQRLRELRELLL